MSCRRATASSSTAPPGRGWTRPCRGRRGTLVLAIDDILFAVADEAPEVRIHAAWHHVLLDSGPYSLEGELATLPGFDPGRSLARPSGEFVLLREIRLSLQGRPEAGVSTGDHALVNRYAVEQIRADLELGFIFPGATVAPKPTGGRRSRGRPDRRWVGLTGD